MPTPTLTPREAADGLRRGDFSRLAPLFGDAGAPDRAGGPLLAWVAAGAFDAEPDVLAEALTCACWLGQTGVATRLLERGVAPSGGAGTGLDALHWAANRGQVAAVRLLLAHGAPTETRSMYGGTALGTAVWSAVHEPLGDQRGAIAALLAAGADVSAVDRPTGHAGLDALLAAHDGA